MALPATEIFDVERKAKEHGSNARAPAETQILEKLAGKSLKTGHLKSESGREFFGAETEGRNPLRLRFTTSTTFALSPLLFSHHEQAWP